MIGFLEKAQIVDIHKYPQTYFLCLHAPTCPKISSVTKQHKYWVFLCSLCFGNIFSEFMFY